MRKTYYFFLIYIILTLTGCVSREAQEVMSPIKYTKPFNLHVNKNAYLIWESGDNHAGTYTTVPPPDLVGAIITMAVDNANRTRNPGRYTYIYGNPQQAVFMTSFRDALQEHHVFKKASIITSSTKMTANDVLITVKFRQTRTANSEKLYAIKLSVDMTIQNKKSIFKRQYFVQNKNEKWLTFKEQQTEVSQELLEKLMDGVNQWYKQL